MVTILVLKRSSVGLVGFIIPSVQYALFMKQPSVENKHHQTLYYKEILGIRVFTSISYLK